MRAASLTEPHRHPGFTLIELMLVLVVMAIAYGLAAPMLSDTREFQLAEAARMLAADIEFAQQDSITHPDDPRIVTFDTTGNSYAISSLQAMPAGTPISHPSGKEPFVVSYGTGRAERLAEVTIESIDLGGDAEVRFDAFGLPDQVDDPSIVLGCGGGTMTVRIDADTGDVTTP